MLSDIIIDLYILPLFFVGRSPCASDTFRLPMLCILSKLSILTRLTALPKDPSARAPKKRILTIVRILFPVFKLSAYHALTAHTGLR